MTSFAHLALILLPRYLVKCKSLISLIWPFKLQHYEFTLHMTEISLKIPYQSYSLRSVTV